MLEALSHARSEDIGEFHLPRCILIRNPTGGRSTSYALKGVCPVVQSETRRAYNQRIMKDLEEEQRKMRERMQVAQRKKTSTSLKSYSSAESPETMDVQALLKRIEVLEAENASLRRQLSALRDQPRSQEPSSEMSERERRHLFMKYSNLRRY